MDQYTVEGSLSRRQRPIAFAVNTMLVADRPIQEAFELAAELKSATSFKVVIDLRSRRSAHSDPLGHFSVCHHGSDFDLATGVDVENAIALSRAYGIEVASVSPYLGACHPEDKEYGLQLIKQSARMAKVSPNGTIMMRTFGGIIGSNTSMKEKMSRAISTTKIWVDQARRQFEMTGQKVVIAFEVHHGHLLSDVDQISLFIDGLAPEDLHWLGFIDDPANRFIEQRGLSLSAQEFLIAVNSRGGAVVAHHMKDVAEVESKQIDNIGHIQTVGERFFSYQGRGYEWTELGQGALDLQECLKAVKLARTPFSDFDLVSAEYVAASADKERARAVLLQYVDLLEAASVD